MRSGLEDPPSRDVCISSSGAASRLETIGHRGSIRRRNGMVIERLSELPSGSIDALVAESEQAGYRFMRRLAQEWASGANRFDGAGEAFFASLIGGRVIGDQGINGPGRQL